MARYVAALLGGGAGERGSVLGPETLAAMFAPQYQPDPRLPGVGLAFYRREVGGHLIVEKDGLVRGFASQMFVAPHDGAGVVAFTNGARAAHGWLGSEVLGILRDVLGVPGEGIRTAVPHHPEIWGPVRVVCVPGFPPRPAEVGRRRSASGRAARSAHASARDTGTYRSF